MDNLTRDQRSFCMSRVRSRDTGIEVLVRSELHRRGMRFRKHCGSLPGRPDVVFSRARVAVFVDGDFWHGYRFPAWRERLSDHWAAKIEANRARDRRTIQRLRRSGWRVVRIWQHEVEANVPACIDRVEAAVRDSGERRVTGLPRAGGAGRVVTDRDVKRGRERTRSRKGG